MKGTGLAILPALRRLGAAYGLWLILYRADAALPWQLMKLQRPDGRRTVVAIKIITMCAGGTPRAQRGGVL